MVGSAASATVWRNASRSNRMAAQGTSRGLRNHHRWIHHGRAAAASQPNIDGLIHSSRAQIMGASPANASAR